MATEVARLRAYLDADTGAFDRKMRQSETTTQRFGRVAKTALVGGAAAGLYLFGKAAKIGWDEYNQGQQVAAQTNAVIKSTGGVANVSAEQVEKLGTALMMKSGVDDEVIKSGENVLLTFRNIRNEAGKGNDIFNQATAAALDLSTALGTDLQSANIQIGKALNGSTTGLTALTRSGVSFNDQQKEMITQLFASGHALEAQKMILKELQVEFGGSAEAAGKTFGGQINIARARLNNFLGLVVEKAIPQIQRFVKWIGPYAHQALELAKDGMRIVRNAADGLSKTLDRHQDTVNRVVKVLGVLWDVYVKLWKVQLTVVSVTVRVWLKIADVVLTVADKVGAAVNKMIGFFRKLGGAAASVASGIGSAFAAIPNAFRAALNAVISAWNALPSFTIKGPGPLPDFTVGVPDLPHVATGGFVERSGLAVIHAGERIMPARVDRRPQVPSVVLNYSTVIGDPRDGAKILRMIEDWQRRGGR